MSLIPKSFVKSNVYQRIRLLDTPNSQVNREKPCTLPWMPFTLRPKFLSFLLAVTLYFLAAVETIRQVSLRVGAVATVDATGQIPRTLTFMYIYFPVLALMLYGLAWAWVDLDIKRLEPYFQLSRNNGALAKDSLLLTYPHDFLWSQSELLEAGEKKSVQLGGLRSQIKQ